MNGLLAAGLGAVIGTAGAAKLLRHGDRAANETPGIDSTSTMPWRLIGGLELALGVALVALRSRLPLLLAIAFLVAATAYLAVRLATLERGPCACWGPRRGHSKEGPGRGAASEALRPAWFFVRNGGLVAATAIALGWSIPASTLAAATVWLLVMIGTLASVRRLHTAAS